MPHSPEDAFFPDGLTPAQQRAVCDALRHRLDARVPDRRLLVLYALDAAGRADELTPDEKRAIEAARADLDAALRAHPSLIDVAKDIEAACADFDAAWAEHASPPTAPRRAADRRARPAPRTAARWGWRVPAAVAVALFALLAVLILQRDAGRTTLDLADGETRLVELADGSTVRLLGGSSLTYNGDAQAFDRRVALTGEAFFEVVPGTQGFSVETPTGVTTVLGTSFGIRADDEAMEVVLATGKVAVAAKAAPDRVVVLEPGQMSRVARNAMPSTPAPVDLPEALAWTGLFVFRATPLHEAAARLSDSYGVPVAVDATLADERITGTFESEELLADVLARLATTLGAQVEQTPDGFRITPP